MQTIIINITPEIKLAAKFNKQSVLEFCNDAIAGFVGACERDYIMHDGEVIGDRRDIEALEIDTFYSEGQFWE